ncbi:hypothetical protein CSPX01_00161 [Colletotrichum filicis]|nr:hypothetical protein CSPX01_00161 [Colletotrichum filicis]
MGMDGWMDGWMGWADGRERERPRVVKREKDGRSVGVAPWVSAPAKGTLAKLLFQMRWAGLFSIRAPSFTPAAACTLMRHPSTPLVPIVSFRSLWISSAAPRAVAKVKEKERKGKRVRTFRGLGEFARVMEPILAASQLPSHLLFQFPNFALSYNGGASIHRCRVSHPFFTHKTSSLSCLERFLRPCPITLIIILFLFGFSVAFWRVAAPDFLAQPPVVRLHVEPQSVRFVATTEPAPLEAASCSSTTTDKTKDCMASRF